MPGRTELQSEPSFSANRAHRRDRPACPRTPLKKAVDGKTYYVYDGTHYRPFASEGETIYMVVDDPAKAQSAGFAALGPVLGALIRASDLSTGAAPAVCACW